MSDSPSTAAALPAAATLIALLTEDAPELRQASDEAALVRVLALVYGFLHAQGPAALLDPDRWLDALIHVPFIAPAGASSDTARGRRVRAELAPRVKQALLEGRAQVGGLPSLPRFLAAVPFLAAPPAAGSRQAVTVVTARAPGRAGGIATLAVTALELEAAREKGPAGVVDYALRTRRSALTLDTAALADARNRSRFEAVVGDADVHALVRLSTFISLRVAPE